MRKFTRSICQKKVKFINKNEQKLKKQAIATAFINNSRDFWSEISKIRKKTHNNKCLILFYLDLGTAYNDPHVIVLELAWVRICGRWIVGIYHVGQNLDGASRV